MNSRAGNILLVEDDPADIELTLSVLSQVNLSERTLALRDGEQALDYLCRRGRWKSRGNGDPAVVVLDLKMPKLSGFDVLRTIKRDERMRLIPVVVFTSSAEKSDVAACYHEGANGYVVKPGDFAQFACVVEIIGRFWSETNIPPGAPASPAHRPAKGLRPHGRLRNIQ